MQRQQPGRTAARRAFQYSVRLPFSPDLHQWQLLSGTLGETGFASTRCRASPEDRENLVGDRILGYDFGMFLYALPTAGSARCRCLRPDDGPARRFRAQGSNIMSMDSRAAVGVGRESGINIEAAIKYAR